MESAGGPPPLAIVCWRGRSTLNILVSKGECQQMAEQLQSASAAAAGEVPQLNGNAPGSAAEHGMEIDG